MKVENIVLAFGIAFAAVLIYDVSIQQRRLNHLTNCIANLQTKTEKE